MKRHGIMRAASLAAVLALAAVPSQASEMGLSSAAVHQGAPVGPRQVWSGGGCGGMNISPDLAWSGAPTVARSFAVTVYDPDAREGRGWWHWLAFNIPPTVMHLPAGAGRGGGRAMPQGAVQSANDFGNAGYDGPCPPPGTGVHHYVFTVFALDVPSIPLDAHASPEAVAEALQRHAIAHGRLTAVYQR